MKIALAGNPNSGKTTLFNALTGSNQYVGNWPGVTVEKKEGKIKGQKDVTLVDLPGIYSLSPYTLEEVVSRKFLLNEPPDAIINIIDATNIERNLYLTTQILELGIPMVIALNMIDIVRKSGAKINISELEKNIGCPVIETSALKGEGTEKIVEAAIKVAKENKKPSMDNKFDNELEKKLTEISKEIESYVDNNKLRWYNIKFFERDKDVLEFIKLPSETSEGIENIILNTEDEFDDDSESIITNERYQYISSTLSGSFTKKVGGQLSTSDKIDRVVTHPVFALPIFIAIMSIVYYLAISTVGTGMTDWVNDVLFGEIITENLSNFLLSLNVSPVLYSLVIDGILAGVGAVLGFLPQMMVLFLLLAILEDSGYMSRIAFIMDKIFRKFGLSGKSFIPMLVTTGCGVPGIMSARTIESERDRRMTIMTTVFIPCSAKLPIIALIAGAFFSNSWWVGPSVYFFGVMAVLISGIILKKTKIFEGDPAPFVMELPAYHFPSIKGLILHTWDKAKMFVKRAGSVIFISSCIIWFLSNFSWSFRMVDAENSILASLGNIFAFVFTPLGWGNWRATVATITGLVAKENIVGTFGVLYGLGEVAEDGLEVWPALQAAFTPLAGYSFLMFNMFCAPCFAAIGAMRKELGSKWMWIGIVYQTVFAYCIALFVYQFGMFFTGNGFGIGTLMALLILFFVFYLLFRPDPNRKRKHVIVNSKLKSNKS